MFAAFKHSTEGLVVFDCDGFAPTRLPRTKEVAGYEFHKDGKLLAYIPAANIVSPPVDLGDVSELVKCDG